MTCHPKTGQILCEDQRGKYLEGGSSRHASYQTTIDIYRHLLPNQLEKGLDDLDLMLLSVDKSVERMN